MDLPPPPRIVTPLPSDCEDEDEYDHIRQNTESRTQARVPLVGTVPGRIRTGRNYGMQTESHHVPSPNKMTRPNFAKKSKATVATDSCSNNAILSYWDLKKEIVSLSANDLAYKVCPTMKEEQQYMMEYSLPLVLPGLMYMTNMSGLGIILGILIVVVHSLQTMVTNFGSRSEEYRLMGWISPLAHHTIDCTWLQLLISTMLLIPQSFGRSTGRSAFYLALVLIQTLPIYLSVSYKSHFSNTMEAIMTEEKERANLLIIEGNGAQKNQPPKKSQNEGHFTYKIPHSLLEIMGNHICACFVWYWIDTMWLAVSFTFDIRPLLWVGLGKLNMTGILLTERYMKKVHKRVFTHSLCEEGMGLLPSRRT